MGDLGNFFNLIGEEKKKKKEEKDDLVGDISLESLFASLSEEKKKNKSKIEEKAREREKLIKDAKVFETFLFSETKDQSLTIKKAVNILEKELLNLKSTSHRSIDRLMRGICSEYKITPRQLHDSFKQKHSIIPDEWVKQQKEEVDTTNWKDDYVPTEIETTNIIEPEPLKKEEDVEISENIGKSMEILDKLIPEEEQFNESETEMARMKREVDQLRKMLYQTIQKVEVQGGGGEVRVEFMDDVDRDSAKVDGRVLQYDAVAGIWTGGIGGGGVVDLGPLTNIATADTTTIPQGAHLEFNSLTGQFIATTVVGAATTNIAGFPVTTGIPEDNTVLTFHQSDEKWVFDSPFKIVDLSDGVEDGHQDYGSF